MLARFNRRWNFIFIGAIAAVLATATPASAPPGDLDPTFGNGGKVVTDFGFEDEAFAIAFQADGKIVAAGRAANSQGVYEFFGLARYNTNGSLDFGFGPNGTVFTDVAPGFDGASGIVLQSDGKIVTAGCTSCFSGSADFALVRYNTDGSLDTGFGTGGKVTVTFNSVSDYLFAVALQSDGKIVAAGSTSGTAARQSSHACASHDGMAIRPRAWSGGSRSGSRTIRSRCRAAKR